MISTELSQEYSVEYTLDMPKDKGPRKEIYGAIEIKVAVTRKELSNDSEL